MGGSEALGRRLAWLATGLFGVAMFFNAWFQTHPRYWEKRWGLLVGRACSTERDECAFLSHGDDLLDRGWFPHYGKAAFLFGVITIVGLLLLRYARRPDRWMARVAAAGAVLAAAAACLYVDSAPARMMTGESAGHLSWGFPAFLLATLAAFIAATLLEPARRRSDPDVPEL